MRTRFHWAPLAAAIGGSLVVAPVVAQPQQIRPEAWAQIESLYQHKAAWTPVQRKISSRLLLELERRRGDPLFETLTRLRPTAHVEPDGQVLVDVKGDITVSLLEWIEKQGGTVVSSFSGFDRARVRLPLTRLEAVAADADVRFIRPAERAMNNKDNTSEGDVAHAAVTARPGFGVDGSGVTVGVLSDGVDTLAARQATGDLPPTVTILPGQSGAGDEGTAMLEIVFDLAPGADLHFATALGGQAQFAQNILDLATAGADVIVDDIFYLAEPPFQDGVVAEAVEAVTAMGVNYFSAAGNSGNLNDGTAGVWEGDFLPIAPPPVVGPFTAHDFGGGTNFDTITADPPSLITLQWSDAAGASGNDYDLLLLDPARSAILDSGADFQDGDDDPFEFIDSGPPGNFNDLGNTLVVVKFLGDDRFLQLNTHRGELDLATAGQTGGHAAAAGAFGVAAVDVADAGGGVFAGGPANPVEDFSSDGPRKIFYQADGTPITPGDFLATGGVERAKPDIAAADGVTTATPGFGTFFGTSAAAPHAAAIAALVQQNGNLTTEGLRAVFAATALDIEAAGPDRDSGFGIVMADAALAAASPTSAVCGPDELTLTGTPNDGPQTFRACQKIIWGDGRFDDVTGRAPLHVFADGFESGDVSAWSNSVP